MAQESGLSVTANAEIGDMGNEVFLSAVSAAEVSIKVGIGKLEINGWTTSWMSTQRQLHQVSSLPLDEESAALIGGLPRIHGDPFDRLLVCQALRHGLTIVTPDRAIRQ